MAAAGTTPAYCDVYGTVIAKGAGVADQAHPRQTSSRP